MTGTLAGELRQTGFLKGVKSDVVLTLASVADGHGQSWYSYKSLAHLSRRSRKAVIESVNWLEARELVTVERGRNIRTLSGRYTGASNLYTLNLQFFEALITITKAVRKATPGSSEQKWETVGQISKWAELQVDAFRWCSILEIAAQPPHFIKQEIYGVCLDEPGVLR